MRRRPCGRQCCAPLTPPFTADSVVRQVVTQICQILIEVHQRSQLIKGLHNCATEKECSSL